MRKYIFLFILITLFTVGCSNSRPAYDSGKDDPIEDEDIMTNNELDMDRIVKEIPGFQFTLPAAWKLSHTNTDRDNWLFEHGPIGGEMAYLSVEVLYGDRFFYKYQNVNRLLYNELKARMVGANWYGTDSFRLLTPDEDSMFTTGTILKGWKMVFADYDNREMHKGTLSVFAHAGIWELKRQILFKMVTTVGGWKNYYATTFNEILKSCNSQNARRFEMDRIRSGKDDYTVPDNDFYEKYYRIGVINNFEFTLSNGWSLVDRSQGKWLFARQLKNHEPALLLFEEEKDTKYFYKDAKIDEKLTQLLQEMMTKNEHANSAHYKIYDRDSEVLNNINNLPGWKFVCSDRGFGRSSEFVFANSGLWEINRQILLKMTTTPKGWADEYSTIYNDILNSCKSSKIK